MRRLKLRLLTSAPAHSRLVRTDGGFSYVRSALDSDRTAYLLPAMRLGIRALSKPLHVSPPNEGRRSAERRSRPRCRIGGCGGAPHERMLPLTRASGARAFRRSTAALARGFRLTGSTPGHASWDADPAGVTRPHLSQSRESTSRTGRSTGVNDARSRPGAGLRAPPAGTALASVIRPSPVTPFARASLPSSHYNRDSCQRSVANKATRPRTRENR